MSDLPPPPAEPPGGRPIPPPPSSFIYGSPPPPGPSPWAPTPFPTSGPEWGPYAQPGPEKRGFVWWESILGAFAGVAGNIVIAVLPIAPVKGLVFLLYNVGWLVVPPVRKHWSYTLGFVVGVIGAIALLIVVVIYSCSAMYGKSGG